MKRKILFSSLGLAAGIVTSFVWADKKAVRQLAGLETELTKDVHYCQLDGTRLAYRHWGEHGPALLMIHGMFGSSYDFINLAARLGRSYQVFALDLIGFGLSAKSPELDFSKKNMAGLAAAFMARQGFSSYFVLGHSMGGEVALHMALAWPDQITDLILISSAGWQDMQKGFKHRPPAWLIDQVGQNFLVQQLVLRRVVHDKKLAARAVLLPFYFFNKQIPAASLQKLLLDNDSGQIKKELARIRQKTLLIWGAKDRIIPLAQGRQLAAHLAGSELIVLEECGHLPYLEMPDRTCQLLEKHLAAISGS